MRPPMLCVQQASSTAALNFHAGEDIMWASGPLATPRDGRALGVPIPLSQHAGLCPIMDPPMASQAACTIAFTDCINSSSCQVRYNSSAVAQGFFPRPGHHEALGPPIPLAESAAALDSLDHSHTGQCPGWTLENEACPGITCPSSHLDFTGLLIAAELPEVLQQEPEVVWEAGRLHSSRRSGSFSPFQYSL